MRYRWSLLLVLTSTPLFAQPVPRAHVPPSVLMEISVLERTFDVALGADCSLDRCTSKGCVYVQHQTVDVPRSSSLPGLPTETGPGSVVPQEYLTEARCEFTYESSIDKRDVQALVRRLEQRLSRAWRKVAVVPQALSPVSRELQEPLPPETPEAPEEAAAPPIPPAETQLGDDDTWNSAAALRELWNEMLPHFWWMVALFLGTLVAMALIWSARRLGKASLEERMMEAQLATTPAPEAPSPEVIAAERQAEAKEAEKKREQELEESYSEQQERLWTERMGSVGASSDDVVVELVRDWLRNGDFPMLARGFLIFGDRLSSAFTSDGSLALKKLEFADYFRTCDEDKLPSRVEFFRRLNQSAMSAHLLSHSDVQLFRSLREEFGSSGVVALMGELPARYAALLFALVPRDTQYDVAKLLAPELRILVAQQLFASSRMSKSEREYVFSSIHAAMEGTTLPPPPRDLVTDRGPAVDAASALSVLLPSIDPGARSALLAKVLQSGRGAAPRWFEDILFPEMLDRLEGEQRKDLLLDVDIRALAAWLSLQEAEWQRGFLQQLSATMQGALRSNASFESRLEQVQLAQEAHKQITKALKTQYAKGRANFVNLAA